MGTPTINFQQSLQEAIQHMQAEISELPKLLAKEANIAAQEAPYLAAEQNDMTAVNQWWDWGPGGVTTADMELNAPNWATFAKGDGQRHFHNYYEDELSLAPLQADMKAAESKIEALDPHLGGLLTSFNQLIELAENLGGTGAQNCKKTIQELQQMLQQMYQMIIDRVTHYLTSHEMSKLGSEGLSSQSPIEQMLATMNSQALDNMRWLQQQLDNNSTTALLHVEKLQTNAQDNEEKQTYWWDDIANAFGAHLGPDRSADRETVREAHQIHQVLITLKQELGSYMFLNTELQMLSMALSRLKKLFEEFLHGSASYLQLKSAMIEAFAILTEISSTIMTQQSSYQKKMAQGALTFLQGKLDQSLAEQQVVDSATKYASIMGTVLDVAKYLGIGLMLFMAPGAAMALMVFIDALLNATHVMSRLQAYLSSKCGAIWGAVLTGVIETAGTVGGAAGLERLAAKVASVLILAEAEATTARALEACIQTTIQETALSGAQDAEASIGTTIRLAVETAQAKVMAAFGAKSVPELIAALARGDLKTAIQTVRKEAAQNASQQLQSLINANTKFADYEMEDIANASANKAVAKAMNTSEDSAAKLGKTAMKQLAWRLGGMTMMSTGSTFAQVIQQNKSKEGWAIALEMVTILMQMIGMIAACTGGTVNIESVVGAGFLSKSFLATTTADGLAQAVGETGQAEAYLHMAKAIKAIAEDQSEIELMQFVLEQLQKDGNQARSALISEIETGMKSTNQVAQNISMAEQALAQALQTMAV